MTAVACCDVLSLTGDAADLRSAFGCFPSGVAAVCAPEGDVPTGSPPARSSASRWTRRWSCSASSARRPVGRGCAGRPRLGVSVLGEHQQAVCRDLAASRFHRLATL
jgi:hypothetical protein